MLFGGQVSGAGSGWGEAAPAVVPLAGREPALQRNSILSRARLPIPPQGHASGCAARLSGAATELQAALIAPATNLCRRECSGSLPARTSISQNGCGNR